MIILADNPNSKGSQLEALTLRLLHHRNYRNCTANVMANGAEIDVRGELLLAALSSPRTQHLICECKAHKTLMDMTQWCKFLGKVFHQETCLHAEVAGCFISLSGVNGHVQGNYDELRRHRASITLLHGDDLLSLIGEIIPFVSLQEINRRVRTMTPRIVSRFEVAYHEGAIYWIVAFSGGIFTIFTADGSPVVGEEATRLTPMVEAELDVSSFLDIHAEVQAQRRTALARTLVIAMLFKSNGSIKSLDSFQQVEDFSPQELRHTTQQLIDEGHLCLDENDRCYVPVVSTDHGDSISAELFFILFGSQFPAHILNSEFYKKHINRALLSEICKIQRGMPIEEEDVPLLIQLLQLSPSALNQALSPMPMIVNARKHDWQNQQLDRFNQDYFRQSALEALKRDFRTRALSEFYHDLMGLRELETTTLLKLKSVEAVVTESQFTERVGIGIAAESLGGGFVHVAMLADAPQPWEIRTHSTPASEESQVADMDESQEPASTADDS